MSPVRILGIVLVVVGIILLVMGYNASQSFGEEVSEAVTGRFSDQTTWYFIAGAASAVGGLLMAAFGKS